MPYPPRLRAEITSADYRYPCWVSPDGRILYANLSPVLRQSHDDGATWITVHSFPHSISAVRSAGDGQLLVCLRDTRGEQPGSIWRSSGYNAAIPQLAQWVKVLDLSACNVYVENSWGISVYDNIVVVAEYGSKITGGNARQAYLSTDHGATWRPIFELGRQAGSHLHGITFDPYVNRIWLTHGDWPYGGICYSDDWGSTWQTVDTGGVHTQPTSMIALESCLLLATDTRLNGVLRIRRRERVTPPTVELAHRIEDNSSLKVVGQLIFRRPDKDAAIYMAFSVVGRGAGVIVATRDGETFHELFRDWHQTGTGSGFLSCLETASGKVIATLVDDRQSSFSRLVADAPEWT